MLFQNYIEFQLLCWGARGQQKKKKVIEEILELYVNWLLNAYENTNPYKNSHCFI
jgi:hypothetical protein